MDAARYEPARRRAPLPDGGLLTVRPVTVADVDGLVALYDGLSGEDRYRRFFSAYYPPRTFFERLATVVERGGYGVVATTGADNEAAERGGDGRPDTAGGDAGRIVGEANYVLLGNGDGELGMMVAADQRGWLGAYMLDALVEAAAARGVPNLEADVLVTNRSMLTLLRSRGYATMGSGDWVSVRLIVGTAGHTPVWPPHRAPAAPGRRPRVLVEAPGGRWHAQAEAEAAGLQVIACSGPHGRRSRCPVLAGQPCPLAAAADAIVVSSAPDDERWGALLEAHGGLDPGVPVFVEPRAGHRVGGPPLGAPGVGAAIAIDDEPQLVVDLVDRLASAHKDAAANQQVPGPKGRSALE
jgi:hypothetical protein